MGQCNFRVVSFPLLGMLTWNRDFCVSQMPPIRETLTVVQSWVSSTKCLVKALKIPIIINWGKNLKCMALNLEAVAMHRIIVIDDVFPFASATLVSHKMPVRAFLLVWVLPETTIAVEINWRLTMLSTRLLICRAPLAVVVINVIIHANLACCVSVFQVPSNSSLPGIRESLLFDKEKRAPNDVRSLQDFWLLVYNPSWRYLHSYLDRHSSLRSNLLDHSPYRLHLYFHS